MRELISKIQSLEKWFVPALRLALGLVFFWFGMLKVFGYNPVYEIVAASFPLLATGAGNVFLGFVEAVIGLGLLFGVLPLLVHLALIFHLLGTFAVFFTGPEVMFSPQFPILTLAGEFVFKNIVLTLSGFVVLGYRRR